MDSPRRSFPLTHPQQRIYLVQRLHEGTPVWNVPYGLRADGALDLPALRRAADLVVAEFDGIRAQFTEEDGEVRQVIAEAGPVPVEVVELPEGGETAYGAWARRWSAEPIWALDAPLYRFACARIGPERWGLILKGHHIVMDGTGALNALRRLMERYEELRGGGEPAPVPARASSLDYLAHEADYLGSAAAAADRDFWLRQFETVPEKLELFPESPEPAVASDRRVFPFPPALAARVEAHCAEHRTSPFRLVLAALRVELARTLRTPDVVIGTAFQNREDPGMADIVSMLVSTVPVRLRTPMEGTFQDLLTETRELMAELREHARYPYDQLAADLRERDGQPPDLLQVTVAQFMRAPLAGGARLEFHCRRALMDALTVYVFHGRPGETGVPLELAIDFQTAVFTPERIEALAGHLMALLADALEHPEKPLADLDLLTPEERRKVLVQFNATEVAYPKGGTLHGLFEARVELAPDAPALVFKDRVMTYGELNARANRLARLLRAEGARPDTIVGLLVDRSMDMVIGALGVLKSGAAYAPIDPQYPEDRIAYMLADSRATLLVTQGHHLGKMDFPARVVNLDDLDALPGDGSDLEPAAGPDSIACLIYTSGSTGNPKGVMLEHGPLVNTVHASVDLLGLTAADRISKLASFSFDASIVEIYPTLAVGAAMHIIPDEIRLNLVPLNDHFEAVGITGCFFTTQLGEQFAELFDNRSLRFMITGGEKLRAFRPRNYKLFNCYGPTETSVYCTAFLVEREYANIPIGPPVANHRIYIVDAQGHPQPVGCPGELCIAGAGLARGYWNLPEKTAATFVANPFEPGRRMYRSGDLARWLPDGSLEHLGRIDRQVKIRGYRIEPGEIEAAILALEGIQECAVVDIKEPSGRISLCAYVVASRPFDAADLAREASRLPDYMQPQFVLRLEALPKTGSGKIDRRALPRPELAAQEGAPYAAPRNDLEASLAVLWQEVLKLPRVGIDDNFFAIGGQSLKATFLLARMQRQVGLQVPMRDFFRTPTIRQLAESGSTAPAVEEDPLVPAPPAPNYPLTPPQAQLFVLSRMEGIGATYNVPQHLAIEGPLDTARLARALQALVDRHPALRTAFTLTGDAPVQVVQPTVRLQRPFQAAEPGEVDGIARAFARPFDLGTAPLFRVLLVETGPERYHLMLDVHHIVADGVSLGILLRDLGALYRGEALPPPALGFHDFAVWQQRQREAGRFEPQGRFWHDLFTDPQPSELPTDRPRGAAAGFKGGSCHVVLEREVYRDLTALAAAAGATLHIVLLAGLHLLVGRYARQEDVITGTSMAGRTREEVADLVGMFVTTVPVRSFPKADLTFRAYLDQVKRTMLEVHQNLDYPLERLYEALALRRGAGRHPLFDVNLVLRNIEMGGFGAEGLKVERRSIPTGTCKFDISMAADEGHGTVAFRLDYRTDLFDAATVERFAGHFLALLGDAARNPDRRLGDLDMLAPAERHRLLVGFNPPATPLPDWDTVVTAFDRHAALRPGATALVAEDGRLTYAALAAKAGALAGRFQALGVGRDEVVAIMADRSASVVVAMLAAVKAGGAYTAVDPKYPAERIRLILEGAGARVLAGNAAALAGVAFDGPRVVLDAADADPAPALSGSPGPGDLAYLIYTSGSTGKPKGVMVEHRSLANFLGWYTRLHGFSPEDRCAAYASFSFDACVAQVWAPLVSGAALHVIAEDLRLSPEALNAYFEREGITHAHFPTQFAEQFMAMTDNRSLQRMVVGGDALRTWKAGHFRLVNEYGPSETTVASTAILVDRPWPRVPIGRPADNTRVYILDGGLHLQPVGVPGEICIAGAGLARGYRNNPDQTAERFVPDPFVPGARMYRTGDLGRWLPDGNLEFLGRVDFQVKIRGFRIELAEIEQALGALPGVHRSIVLARTDAGGGKYLCAYYEADAEIPLLDLKRHLAGALPEYMVPSAFVHMVALPINRNGKIDRPALPDPVFTAGEVTAPRNEVEARIAEAWRKVLRGWEGGVHDGFFECGGDSLRAIALVAELQKGFEVRVGDIFAHPTIAQQAEHLVPVKDNLKLRLGRLRDGLAATAAARAALASDAAFQAALAGYRQRTEARLAQGPGPRTASRHLLLTGATGYLGAYLLRELLETRPGRITALVRAADDGAARARLQAKLDHYFGPGLLDRHEGRLAVLAADLAKDRLGLAPEVHAGLAGSLDAILHCAANVRHYGPYEEFHAANVRSTEQLADLAGTGAPKSLHTVSTTSTGHGVEDRPWALFTEEDLDIGQAPQNVYVRSKLEGERVVAAARARGLDARTYRVGNVAYDAATGGFQENIEENAFFQQVKAYANLGCAPDQGDERNLTFVDQCARAIVALHDREDLAGGTFHLSNPHRARLSTFLRGPGLGLALRALDTGAFVDFLAESLEREPFREPIEHLMLHMGWLDGDPGRVGTLLSVRTELTDGLLAQSGFKWPVPEPAGLRPMVLAALAGRRAALGRAPAFALLDGAELDGLALAGRPVWIGPEAFVAREGEVLERPALPLSGLLEVSKTARNGWQGTVRLLGPGDLVGKDALLHGLPSPVTVQALPEGACLLEFEDGALQGLLAASPRLALGLAKNLSQSVNRLESLFVNQA